VINEFGGVGVDSQLVIGADEEIVELNNGCLCCRMRGDLIRSLGDLVRRQKRFDYVLVETTGLADPSPIAHTFIASELAKHFRLDGIVTVVDARHFEKELNDCREPRAQVAFADVILLNKTDLVSPAELDRLEARLRRMNTLARTHRTTRSQVEVGKLLNLRARELTAPLPEANGHESHADHECGPDCHEHHDHGHEAGGDDHEPHHHHDESVRSFFLEADQAMDLKKLEIWLSQLLTSGGENIYRCKGVLHVKGQPKRVVCQGVQMMFDSTMDRFWGVDEKRRSVMVFIGKDLDETAIRAGFSACVAA